jgi:EXS family
MDWGMMKNPSVAAAVVCNPVSSLSNNGSYSTVPTRDHMDHRAPIARTVSGPITPASLSCWYSLLRNRLRFGVAMSVLILVADIILRFSWVLRFYHKLFPSGDSFVLCSQFLEVFRRALWNLLRVEWENLKQSGHHLSGPVKPPPSMQLMSLSDEEKAGFLTRGHGSLSKLPNGHKITVEKNAEA